MMRRSPFFLALLLISALMAAAVPQRVHAAATPDEGAIFPDLTLPLPQKVEERDYLMIEQGPFRLSQVKADVLIVEIFNMYCPHCQKEAPNVNALHKAIASRKDLSSRVKLIGIGAGNSNFEVNAFRNLYRIRFPLFPDKDLSLNRQLGEIGTPYFFVLRNAPPGRLEVIYSQPGSFGDPAAFVDMIAAKMKPKGSKKK